jgi:hypothetical protein
MSDPFLLTLASTTTDPMEELSQAAFGRRLGLVQGYYRKLTSAGGSLDAREREMAQDVLSDLCVSYRALPERDRTNLGEDVEEIFQIMAEELVRVEGTEDWLLAGEVLEVFLGASTVHPLGSQDFWPEEDVCSGRLRPGGRRNTGGQTLNGSVIWLELPQRRLPQCGCSSDAT